MDTTYLVSILGTVIVTLFAAYTVQQLRRLITALHDVHDELEQIREMTQSVSVQIPQSSDGWIN